MVNDLYFADTSYLIALESARDQNHASASHHWLSFPKTYQSIIITNYIFDEVVTFFNKRGLHKEAVKLGEILLSSQSIKIEDIDTRCFYESWDYFKKHSDKDYSFTDCVSFVIMKRYGIKNSLSFDKHFEQAGFNNYP